MLSPLKPLYHILMKQICQTAVISLLDLTRLLFPDSESSQLAARSTAVYRDKRDFKARPT